MLRTKDEYRSPESLGTSFDASKSLFISKETLTALEELGDILKRIHQRMTFEGYEIVEGSIQKTSSTKCI